MRWLARTREASKVSQSPSCRSGICVKEGQLCEAAVWVPSMRAVQRAPLPLTVQKPVLPWLVRLLMRRIALAARCQHVSKAMRGACRSSHTQLESKRYPQPS